MAGQEDYEDVEELFQDVLTEIKDSCLELMHQLWYNWSHLGVEHQIKVKNIKKLVEIENALHQDVVLETDQELKALQDEVQELKSEASRLGEYLSKDISLDYKDTMMLVEYKKTLQNRIKGYREQVHLRRSEMERLLEWQRDLADKLGVTIEELKEVPLPSADDLNRLKAHLEVLQGVRDKRVETFLNSQMEIKDIMEKLQIKTQNKFELLVVTSLSVDFKVTDHNMEQLARLKRDLQIKYEHTNNRVLELRERLTKLWECLEEDHIYRESFLQAHPGCHLETEAALKDEIWRCDQIKRQKIQMFVANARTKIKLMWDKMMFTTAQREVFVHYYQDQFTETNVKFHELYLEGLNKLYSDHKNIYDLMEMRKELWAKMSDLEARATEPGRYNNRGGQLLREEKERKAIATKLPKIEEQLRELVTEHEAKTGEQFMADGKPLLQLIADEWENRKTERQNKLSARKQLNTRTSPALLPSLATSALGKRNRSAAGLGYTADKNRPPTKRPLVTRSADRPVYNVTDNSALMRSTVSTAKRRISGRLAARLVTDGKPKKVIRKLDYDSKAINNKVHTSILKHKRKSSGRRSSTLRSTMNSTTNVDDISYKTLMESTIMGDYSQFRERINAKQISRSSLAYANINIPTIRVCEPSITPDKTPKKTPKNGNENYKDMEHMFHIVSTPCNRILKTPTRLTGSAIKLNFEGIATLRKTPFSVSEQNLQREKTVPAKSPLPNMGRSASYNNLTRVKNLPLLL